MRRTVLLYPDPALRRFAEPMGDFGDALAPLLADLQDTMDAVSAIGLTAPHIGEPARVALVRLDPRSETHAYINPEIVWASEDRSTHAEGSVSMPGLREDVTRPDRVRVRYQAPDGRSTELEASGFEAAVLQHEIDQLDGIFWIDRLSRLKRERLLKRWEKLRRRGGP